MSYIPTIKVIIYFVDAIDCLGNYLYIYLSLARHEQVIVHFKYIDCGGCRLIGRDPGDILTFIRLFRPKLRRSGLNPTRCPPAKRLPPTKN